MESITFLQWDMSKIINLPTPRLSQMHVDIVFYQEPLFVLLPALPAHGFDCSLAFHNIRLQMVSWNSVDNGQLEL